MTRRTLQPALRWLSELLPLRLPVVLAWLLLLSAPSAQAWWSCDWGQRVRIDLSAAAPAGELTELLIRRAGTGTGSINGLLPANYTMNELYSSLRVVALDDTTEIPFYLDSQNGSNASNIRLWIKPTAAVSSFYLYLDNTTAATASSPSIFDGVGTSTQLGFRYHTRRRQASVDSLRLFFNRFDAQPDNVNGYGCTVLNNASNTIENSARFPSGSNRDILTTITFVLNVPAAEAGNWGIRFGGDFGDGGGIYVDGTALDQKWGTDLWWSWNWSNTAELLSGDINLSAGAHLVTIYGGEGCCDGSGSIQLRKPSGSWLVLNDTNFPNYTRAPQCNARTNPTPLAAPETPVMSVTKTAAVLQDPINGTTNPYAISGARVRYTVKVEQTSKTAPDSGSLVLRDAIPANASFIGTSPIPNVLAPATATPLLETPPATTVGKAAVDTVMWWPDNSGLSLDSTNIAYSSTGSAPFVATMPGSTDPTTGANSAVKAIQISPQGSSTACGSPAAPVRFFTEFDVLIN